MEIDLTTELQSFHAQWNLMTDKTFLKRRIKFLQQVFMNTDLKQELIKRRLYDESMLILFEDN